MLLYSRSFFIHVVSTTNKEMDSLQSACAVYSVWHKEDNEHKHGHIDMGCKNYGENV